jgi:tetratricopeptide (TPR) repeat protein
MRIFSRFAAVAVLFATLVGVGASEFSKWRGVIKAAEQAMTKRDFEKARALLEDSEAQAAAVGPESSAQNSFLLGRAYAGLDRAEDMKQTIEIALEKLGPKIRSKEMQVWRGLLLYDYSRAHYFLGDLDGAMANAVTALKTLEEIGGRNVHEIFYLHTLIGDIHMAKKNLAEAEKEYVSALKIASTASAVQTTEWSGSNTQNNLYIVSAPAEGKVNAGVSLGNLYIAQGRYAEAEKTLAKALSEAEAGYGKKADYTAVAMAPLAIAEFKLGKVKEFDQHADRIYQMASKRPGFRFTALEPFWLKFDAAIGQGDAAEAGAAAKQIAALVAAQNIEAGQFGERAVYLVATNEPTDWNRARKIHETLSQAASGQFAAAPVKVAQFQFQFVNFGMEQRRYDFAVAALDAVVKAQEKSADKTLLLGVCNKMAEIRIAEKKPAEALPYLQQSVDLLRAKYGEDSRTAGAMDKEAALLKTLARDKESEELTARANQMRAKAIGK